MTESLRNKCDISRKSPEIPVKRRTQVVMKEMSLERNAPWDLMAMDTRMFRLFTTITVYNNNNNIIIITRLVVVVVVF